VIKHEINSKNKNKHFNRQSVPGIYTETANGTDKSEIEYQKNRDKLPTGQFFLAILIQPDNAQKEKAGDCYPK
jgi:hypothetical protein